MPMKLVKTCKWCGSEMLTTRSTKILCSQRCHNQFHYWRTKNFPDDDTKVALKVIDNWLSENTHPNPGHPINLIDAIAAELFRQATTQTTQQINHLESIATYGKQHEEAL